MTASLVVVSNRGPISFGVDERGRPVPGTAGGGLASTLGSGVRGHDAVWVAATMTDGDRAALTQCGDANGELRTDGYRLRLVDIDPEIFSDAYDVVANQTLWFWHHHMFDLVRGPRIGVEFRDAWASYRAFNSAMARATADAAAPNATVLVHDYHLALMPAMLRKLRPDVRISHFSHTPWADAAFIHVLPEPIVGELLEGMAGAHALGFHSPRWAAAFEACWDAHPLTRARPFPDVYIAPAAADHRSVLDAMGDKGFAAARTDIESIVGDRKCIVRVDRMEPSKNLLRGFGAYATLLESHPEWHGAVNFVAVAYPSRSSLDEYKQYRVDVEAAAAEINQRYGTPDWSPVVLCTEEGYERSVAMLQRADVVFVNPIRDGLNLVVYEAQTATERDSVLVLSRETGAWDELGHAGAIGVNPFDECEQADALHRALSMSSEERRARGQRLFAAATARTPAMWLALQVEAVEKDADNVHVLTLREPSDVHDGFAPQQVG